MWKACFCHDDIMYIYTMQWMMYPFCLFAVAMPHTRVLGIMVLASVCACARTDNRDCGDAVTSEPYRFFSTRTSYDVARGRQLKLENMPGIAKILPMMTSSNGNNSRVTGPVRCHRAHYDVNVMLRRIAQHPISTPLQYQAQCSVKVNFSPSIHKTHPIVCPGGRNMGCILWD